MRFRSVCALLVVLAPRPGAPEVIERIVAVVDGRPVTVTEVAVVERLRGIDRAAATEAVIDERLMFQEAVRLPQAAVTGADEQRAYDSLRARVAPGAELLPEELRTLARRETAILKYVDFRFRSQVRVSDQAVRAAYDAELAGRPDAPAFDAAAPAIRDRLAARQLDERIEAWVKELRAGADIRWVQ